MILRRIVRLLTIFFTPNMCNDTTESEDLRKSAKRKMHWKNQIEEALSSTGVTNWRRSSIIRLPGRMHEDETH